MKGLIIFMLVMIITLSYVTHKQSVDIQTIATVTLDNYKTSQSNALLIKEILGVDYESKEKELFKY